MTDSTYRVLTDGLIHRAEMLPREHRAAHHLRDAAASLLDADMCLNPANDCQSRPAAEDAA